MEHLGAHVYRWSKPDQIRLLREGVRPTAAEARSRDLCDRFWYTVFDARGPHVFAIFSLAREEGGDAEDRKEALEGFVRERLEGWLEAHPSTETLDRSEVEERHRACRGKILSPLDEEPGLAANDSLELFDQPPDRYPFLHTRDMARAGELWRELDAVSFWALDHLTEAVAAIRLVVGVDRALAAGGAPAAAFWRYVATTLLVPLRERLQRGEKEILEGLPKMIGAKNVEVFSRLWEQEPAPEDPPIERAGRLAFEDDGRPLERRMALLREIVHSALGQLLQGVQFRLPVILYAWHRNL